MRWLMLPADDQRDEPLTVGLNLGIPAKVGQETANDFCLFLGGQRNRYRRATFGGGGADLSFHLKLTKLVVDLACAVRQAASLINTDEMVVNVESHDRPPFSCHQQERRLFCAAYLSAGIIFMILYYNHNIYPCR